jgi:hypothetical protein
MILAAFAPDKGELVNTLIADPPPRWLILWSKDGLLPLDHDTFHGSFAADLPAEQPRSWPPPRSPRT